MKRKPAKRQTRTQVQCDMDELEALNERFKVDRPLTLLMPEGIFPPLLYGHYKNGHLERIVALDDPRKRMCELLNAEMNYAPPGMVRKDGTRWSFAPIPSDSEQVNVSFQVWLADRDGKEPDALLTTKPTLTLARESVQAWNRDPLNCRAEIRKCFTLKGGDV